jgi:PGF-pre-PGF domain-containing protein
MIKDKKARMAKIILLGILLLLLGLTVHALDKSTNQIAQDSCMYFNSMNEVSRPFVSVSPGFVANVYITEDNIAFTRVTFQTKKLVRLICIKIRKMEEEEITQKVPGGVYQYLQLQKKNLDTVDIESAAIDFKVAKDWLEKNNVSEKNITLYRMDNNWTELNSTKVTEDKLYVYYNVKIHEFSLFAISTKSYKANSTKELNQSVDQNENRKGNESIKENESIKAPAQEIQTLIMEKPTPITDSEFKLYLIAVIVALALFILVLIREHEIKNHPELILEHQDEAESHPIQILINRIDELLKENRKKEAMELYKKLYEAYSELPKPLKPHFFEACQELRKKLES